MRWIITIALIFCLGMIPLAFATTYTPTTETNCINNSCTKTIYSATQFIEEDSKWKSIQDARSLLSSDLKIEYIENDPNYIVEVIDYNYTSVTLNLNPAGIKVFPTSVPLRIYNGESKDYSNFKTALNKTLETDLSFSLISQSKTLTIPTKIGDVIEFGLNSTTLVISDANSINDTYIDSSNPLHNFGASSSFETDDTSRGLISFWNLTSYIPSTATINKANLSLNKNSGGLSSGITIHRVLTSWVEGTGDGTNCADGANWTRRNCVAGGNAWGTAGMQSGVDYTATAEYTLTGNPVSARNNFTVTNLVQNWINGSYTNYGFVLLEVGTASTNWDSSDNVDSTKHPYLVVDYDLPASPDSYGCSYTTGNWINACNCTINSNVDLGGNNFIINSSGTFVVNANITNIGKWVLASGCKVVVRNGQRFG